PPPPPHRRGALVSAGPVRLRSGSDPGSRISRRFRSAFFSCRVDRERGSLKVVDAIQQIALHRRVLTCALGVVVMAIGLWSWSVLKKEASRDVGDTQVTILSGFPGRAAEEVENQVTLPLERALNSVPRVLSRRSKTIFGLSVIYLTFEDGVDDYWARQRVLEK